MPTTYNGCGTRYAGKSNVSTRRGRCKSCGQDATLTSYDTRLCVVILFIPVLPLGKKRIIDECGHCRRHYVMKLQQWETQRQLGVSGALDDYRTGPTVEKAVAAHATLVGFRQMQEADALRQELEAKFPDSVRLQLYFAESDREHGQGDRADAAVQRAFGLRPDLPETRIAMAGVHRRNSRLEEGRALIDLLEKPGSGSLYPLGELELQAYAWQEAGHHREALDMMQHLLKELPAVGQIPAFRKRIERSEKALQVKDSLLPKRDRSLKALLANKSSRRWVLAGAAAMVIAAGMLVRNEFVRRHRTLTVVNGHKAPLSVSVDGGAAVNVAPGARATVTLAEGGHRAAVSGAITEDIPFAVATGYFERWSKDPVFVLNPGGVAALEFIRATYSRSRPPPVYRVHLGERFTAFPDVDYPFKELPETVSVKNSESKVLTSLNVARAPMEDVLAFISREQGPAAAIKAAEAALSGAPDDEGLLNTWRGLAETPEQQQRAKSVLEKGLSRRPVAVRWHRTWQDFQQTPDSKVQVLAQYRQWLAAEPENADLLYLTGRAMGDGLEAMALYEKAQQLAPKSPWPVFILGYLRMEQGRWEEARELLQQANELVPGDARFAEALFDARLGCGEAVTLAKELKTAPSDNITAQLHRLRALTAADNLKEGAKVSTALQGTLKDLGTPEESRNSVLYQWLYMSRQFDVLSGLIQPNPAGLKTGPAKPAALAWLDLQEGRPGSAQQHLADAGVEPDATIMLSFWVSAQLAGEATEIAACRKDAAAALDQAGGSMKRAAELIRQETAVTPEQLAAVFMEPEQKALLCVGLAGSHPDQKAFLNEQAKRLSVDRRFPAEVIARALAR